MKRKVFFGDVVIYTLTQRSGEVEDHAPFPTLRTAPRPEHLRFLIGFEESGPRIQLAKHSPHQSSMCVPKPILGCELRLGHGKVVGKPNTYVMVPCLEP